MSTLSPGDERVLALTPEVPIDRSDQQNGRVLGKTTR